MGFTYKSINTKTPSMAEYSGNVVDFKYQDTKVDNVEMLDAVSTEVETINIENLATSNNSVIDSLPSSDDINRMTGCVIATGSLSLLEGLFTFGEDVVDFGAILGTVLLTPKAYLADKILGLFGIESNLTESMWEDTRSFVSKEHVKSAFDGFYDNTEYGQYLKENTPGFDTVRAVGNTIGYSTGVIGTAAFTGGVSPASLAAVAGMSGTAKHTSEAWNDGATTGKGLLYGAAAGGWDAFQWYAGGKIAQFGGLGEAAGSSFLHSPALERFARIGMDSVDGGLEGIVQPALSLIYKDYGQDNVIDNYKAAFGEAGGWKAVGAQTLLSGGMSTLGELGDMRRLLKDDSSPKTNSEPSFKEMMIAKRDERYTKLKSLLNDDTLMEHNNSIFSFYSTRSKLEDLINQAIKSGEFNTNTEVNEMINKLLRENITEYLSGTDENLSKLINQYIIDSNLIEDTIAGLDDVSSSRTIQNLIEDKLTSHIINSSDFPVTADQVASNIADSLDKHGLDIDYKHIVTYDESLLKDGGYHKIGAPEFCSNGNCTTKYLGFNDRPLSTEMVYTAEPHTELLDADGIVFKKNIYPLNYTHQQIYDTANGVIAPENIVPGKGRDGCTFYQGSVSMGGRDIVQQVVVHSDGKSIVTTFLSRVKKLNSTEKNDLLRFK